MYCEVLSDSWWEILYNDIRKIKASRSKILYIIKNKKIKAELVIGLIKKLKMDIEINLDSIKKKKSKKKAKIVGYWNEEEISSLCKGSIPFFGISFGLRLYMGEIKFSYI